jgi:lipopolysaccharide transport system ATP-binding protein
MGSLIALGAGFNPILSGRENIVANAMVLGLSNKEIKDKIDDIIDFSDLREFIDAPVRNYSSGMQVRLGFAIATAIHPDILVLDEVLAVGDAAFRQKCYSRLRKMMKNSAVIFVSHSMEYISQTCNKVAVMEQGIATLYNDVNNGIAQYNEQFRMSQPTEKDEEDTFRKIAGPITCATINLSKRTYLHGEPFQLTIELNSEARLPDPIYVFTAINQHNQMVMTIHTGRLKQCYEIIEGKQRITLSIPKLDLHEGVYRWHFNLAERGKIEHLIWYNNAGSFEVQSTMRPVSDIPYVPTPDRVYIENIAE